ncbi:MAG: hypothetical protein WD357_04610 [Gracilimonas sp.]
MNYIEDSFVDKNRPVQMKYHELMDKIEAISPDTFIHKIEKLMDEDPDFLDTYLLMHEVYQDNGELKKADRVLDDAYNRATNLITDKKGNWPESLMWGFHENRHIIRTLLNKAIQLWDKSEREEALNLFRKLLKTNPNDNIGARNYILAIRMDMSFEEYEKRFNKGGYYDTDSINWFEENAPKYPDEFGWWFDWNDENV